MSYKAVEWDEMELSGGELLAKDRCLSNGAEWDRLSKGTDPSEVLDSTAGLMQGKQ